LSQLHSNRAQARSKLGEFEQAIEDCEAAIKSDRNNAKAYWRGANAAMKIGRPTVAADLCKRGLESVGDSLDLRAMLDEAEAAAKSGGSAATEGAALAPASAQQKEKAPLDLQQVVSTTDLADRGETLLERYRRSAEGERDEDDVIRARRIFEKVLLQDRKNETALLGLGEILDDGLGCEKDPGRATQLWMVAMNAGSTKAQLKMALQGLGSWALTLRAQALDHREPPKPSEPAPEPPRRWRPGDKL